MDRKQLRQLRGEQPLWKENPLEVVGLTPTILGLGLSEDDLHTYCRRVGAILLNRFHPDRYGGVELPGVKRISEALTLISNLEVFREALEEFRETHTYRRAEERSLIAQVRGLEQAKAVLQRDLEDEKAFREREARFHEWVCTYLVGQSMRFSSEHVRSLAGSASAVMASLSLSFTALPNEEARSKLTALYRKASSRAKGGKLSEKSRGSICRVINENHLTAVKTSRLIDRAVDSGFELPAIRWGFGAAVHEMGFPKLMPTLHLADREVVREAPEEARTPLSVQIYGALLRQLSAWIGSRYLDDLMISPERVILDGHFLQGESSHEERYVVGTVPIEVGFSCIRTSLGILLVLDEDIVPEIEPFIAPGKAVVSILPAKEFSPHAITTATALSQIRERVEMKARSRNDLLILSHVVLDIDNASGEH